MVTERMEANNELPGQQCELGHTVEGPLNLAYGGSATPYDGTFIAALAVPPVADL